MRSDRERDKLEQQIKSSIASSARPSTSFHNVILLDRCTVYGFLQVFARLSNGFHGENGYLIPIHHKCSECLGRTA